MGRTFRRMDKKRRKKLKDQRQDRKSKRLTKAGEYGQPKRREEHLATAIPRPLAGLYGVDVEQALRRFTQNPRRGAGQINEAAQHL